MVCSPNAPRSTRPYTTRKEHATNAAAPRTDRVYHGWHIAWVMALSAGFSIGMAQYAFGVFAEPLETEFGWTRAQLNGGLSISFVSGLLAPFLGRLIDRTGTRPILVASLLLVAAGFLVRPLMSQLWHWYLFNALVFTGYPGTTLLAQGKLVSLWFPKTTGRMMGLVTSGNNFGGLTMTYLAVFLVAAGGWRWAFVGFGLLVAALAVAAAFLVRDSAADVARAMARAGRPPAAEATARVARAGLTVHRALRSPAFYLITLGLAAASFTYSAVLTQLILHLRAEGFAENTAGYALMLVAAMGIGSKIAFGRLSETITARYALVISLALQAGGLGLMVAGGGAPVQWAGVFVFGLGFGGLGALIVLVVSEAFGLRAFGAIMGLVSLAMIVPQVAGPLLAGALYDSTGSYRLVFTVVLGIFGFGALCMLVARPPAPPQQAESGSGD